MRLTRYIHVGGIVFVIVSSKSLLQYTHQISLVPEKTLHGYIYCSFVIV